jgi:hypothetical protein
MNTATIIVPTDTPGQLSYDLEQFCDLLARIYVRCLQEHDSQALARLTETSSTYQEVNHVAA